MASENKSRPKSFYFGHPVYYVEEKREWFYLDDDTPLSENKRPCPKCLLVETEDGHDPCIKNLPGVKNACCGHGVKEGYIQFADRRVIRFNLTAVENKNLEPTMIFKE